LFWQIIYRNSHSAHMHTYLLKRLSNIPHTVLYFFTFHKNKHSVLKTLFGNILMSKNGRLFDNKGCQHEKHYVWRNRNVIIANILQLWSWLFILTLNQLHNAITIRLTSCLQSVSFSFLSTTETLKSPLSYSNTEILLH